MLTKQLSNLDKRKFNAFCGAQVSTDLCIPIFMNQEPLFRLKIKTVLSVCTVKSQQRATTL